MPISLTGFVGYIRTRQARVGGKELELWIDPTPRRANEQKQTGKVILPKYDCAGVLYLVAGATPGVPAPAPDAIPAEGFAGYLRRNPENGECWIDAVLDYKRGPASYTLGMPPDSLGVFYVDPTGKAKLELRYPVVIATEHGPQIYQIQFPEE